MKRHPGFRLLWNTANAAVLASFFLFLYGFVWEYSTRSYLRGFADAVVPADAPAEQKVVSILAWMARGPERLSEGGPQGSVRNPEETLNYQQLLQVCGTATNALINLATSSGMEARRLLLLDKNLSARHVVAEVRIGGEWMVVDPLYRTVLRNAQGRMLTKQELQDPLVFREVTSRIPGYNPQYTYERTAHVRLARIPLVGRPIRGILDKLLPGWDSSPYWSLVVERESLAWTVIAAVLLLFSMAVRWLLGGYVARRLQITRTPFRERMRRLYEAFLMSDG